MTAGDCGRARAGKGTMTAGGRALGLGMATGKAAGAGCGPEAWAGASPGLGIRGGCLLAVCPRRLPGMAGVRTLKWRRLPSGSGSATSGFQPIIAGSATGAAHAGQVVVPPPAVRGTWSSAAHWGQGSWKLHSVERSDIQEVSYNYHYFSNNCKMILRITPIL